MFEKTGGQQEESERGGRQGQGKSSCKYSLTWTYSIAAESLKASPCSNVPVACPICSQIDPKAPAVWKYNLRVHFLNKHPQDVNKPEYTSLWHLTNFEKTEIEQIWKRRHTIPVRRAKRVGDYSVVVSDAHKSNNAAM